MESSNHYPDAFNKAVAFILPEEESFVRGHWGDEAFVALENNLGDTGNIGDGVTKGNYGTKYGIDAHSHPGVDIADLDKDGAVAIYYGEWQKHNLSALPDKLAIAAFDVWVNGGQASLWLQKAYNHCHPNLPQLGEDGDLGPVSLKALAAVDPQPILDYFIQERDARFVHLASVYSNDRQFLKGWEQRDVDLKKFLAS